MYPQNYYKKKVKYFIWYLEVFSALLLSSPFLNIIFYGSKTMQAVKKYLNLKVKRESIRKLSVTYFLIIILSFLSNDIIYSLGEIQLSPIKFNFHSNISITRTKVSLWTFSICQRQLLLIYLKAKAINQYSSECYLIWHHDVPFSVASILPPLTFPLYLSAWNLFNSVKTWGRIANFWASPWMQLSCVTVEDRAQKCQSETNEPATVSSVCTATATTATTATSATTATTAATRRRSRTSQFSSCKFVKVLTDCKKKDATRRNSQTLH